MARTEAFRVSPFKRIGERGRQTYYLDIRWRGFPRLKLSTGTGNATRAKAMEHMLASLKRAGRRDLIGLLAERRLTLAQLFEAHEKGSGALEHLHASAASPVIGALLDDWFAWLATSLSAKTRRRYAPLTMHRYRMSWQRLLGVLPAGRAARLSALTAGFVADYRIVRGAGEHAAAAATINRDLSALGAFLTWCTEERGLNIVRPKIRREREPAGRERWLSADEIQQLQRATEPTWWPLFATLIYTGMRVGEAQGLRGADLRLSERRVAIREGLRTLKTASSARDVPIPEPLALVLGAHLAQTPAGPADLVFTGALADYRAARRAFMRAVKLAKLYAVTLHDLRHTFGVHCAQAGVPIARLQKLLGHATAHMTLRYMKHAPESYFAEDAARVAASLSGENDAEAEARAALARGGIKRA
jgi:integrase